MHSEHLHADLYMDICFRFYWVNKFLAYLSKQVITVYREILKEDESGSLKATIEDILFKAKRKRYVNFFVGVLQKLKYISLSFSVHLYPLLST